MSTDLHHLAAAYALDALDADERAEFEAHYPACDVCRREVINYRQTAAQLTVDAVAPPVELRSSILAEVAQTRQLPPQVAPRVVALSSRRPTLLPVLGAVAAVAVLLAGFVFLRSDGDSAVDDRLVALLASPDTMVEPLEGDDGSVSVAWSPSRGEVAVFGSEVAAVGAAGTYELWQFRDGQAAPSILFSPDGDGQVFAIGDFVGKPDGWGVTIEPKGGSPAPTGEVLFATPV